MTGWDFDKSTSGNKTEFTKFPEGITRIRVIGDSPIMRWTHWMPKASRAVNCPGKTCPICEIRKNQKANGQPQTYSVARRLSIVVINRETNKVEVMEQGVTFFQEVKDIMIELAEKGKSLADVDLKIRRRGTGQQDTSYRIDVDSEYPLTEDDVKLLEDAPSLDELTSPHEAEKILQLIQGATWEEVFYNKESEVEEEIDLK